MDPHMRYCNHYGESNTFSNRELMEAFPEAKVVLSVRNPQTWYKSVHESIFKFHVLREED